MAEVIEVKDGANGFKVLATIQRTPRQHSGWVSIAFQGRRYQVFGGVRNPLFIDITSPLKQREVKPDALVSGGGSIYQIMPLTQAAKDWIEENVNADGMWLGNALCVEHRYIADIVDGMASAGLKVR